MKKRVIALLMAAAMTVGLAACGSGNAEAPAQEPAAEAPAAEDSAEAPVVDDVAEAPAASGGNKILKVQVGPDPETIDPALNSAVDGGNMLLHAFECLLIVDQDGKLAPGQAESWETSEDGLTWTFHLREGLKWSDGRR